MAHYELPGPGAAVLVALPQPYGDVGAPRPYRVADVHGRQLTLLAQGRCGEPAPPSGVPCVVASVRAGKPERCDAAVVTADSSLLVVDVAADQRRHPRYRRPCKVRVEMVDIDLGIVEGVLEDISAGGLRARVPVLLPVDHRAFVTVVLGAGQPILAIAVVRGAARGREPGDVVARLQFTFMAPSHRARLATLLEWPVDDTTPVQRGQRHEPLRAPA